MRAYADLIVALPFALLPKRRWDDWNLPIENAVIASSLLTCLGGAALGITGFFAHMSAIVASSEWTPPPLMMAAYFGYVFFTPRGLISFYLTLSGFIRCAAWLVDDPMGDPIVTGLDALISGSRRSRAA